MRMRTMSINRIYFFVEPRTRVALALQSGNPNSDYINANYIRVRAEL